MKPAAALKALMKHAAAKPGAWEDHPWGETVYKIGKKVFVFLGKGEESYGMSCKLPDSGEAAVTMFGWAEPTGYGLGKSGWVTARFAPGVVAVRVRVRHYGFEPGTLVRVHGHERAHHFVVRRSADFVEEGPWRQQLLQRELERRACSLRQVQENQGVKHPALPRRDCAKALKAAALTLSHSRINLLIRRSITSYRRRKRAGVAANLLDGRRQ